VNVLCIIIFAVKKDEFGNNSMVYIILRGSGIEIIFLNVHAPTEDEINDVKDIS
jgi:hypothetical protein